MTPDRRAVLWTTSVIAMVAVLAACGSDADDEPARSEGTADTLEVQTTGDGPTGLTADDAPSGDAASMDGRLIVGPGGCLALTADPSWWSSRTVPSSLCVATGPR